MSSNILVQRICQNCGKEFTAQTTVTRFCSKRCSGQASKAKSKTAKIEASNKETFLIKAKPFEELKAKEFLSVLDVAKLIGCSRQTVYSLINSGRLKAVNLLVKKTIIKRSEIDKLFEQPQKIVLPRQGEAEIKQFEIGECYNLTEVQKKFGISETALQQLIRRFNVPKIKARGFAYVPKIIIDELLKQS